MDEPRGSSEVDELIFIEKYISDKFSYLSIEGGYIQYGGPLYIVVPIQT